MSGISVLTKETQRAYLPFPPCEDTREETAVYQPGRGTLAGTKCADTLILHYQPPKLRNK